MNPKKAIAASAVTVLMCNSVLGVSAANSIPDAYVDALIKSGKSALILDVDAYKAAYSDLHAAFGDDTNAYIEHYLTQGVLEGRTQGVLFNPLVYAEAYGDVKAAYGDDILSIVEHYVSHGVAENRTIGTANGYADLAEAQTVQALAAGTMSASNAANRAVRPESIPGGIVSAPAADANTVTSVPAYNNADTSATGDTPVSVPVQYDTPVSVPVQNSTPVASAPAANETPASAPVQSAPAADTGSTASTGNTFDYHHTTSIYENDNVTLIRVEYYDDNNKLINYSSVTDFDSSTNSYTENIYTWDNENQTSVLVRTDTYMDGSLSSSETP